MGATTSKANGTETTATGQEKMEQITRTLINKIEHPTQGTSATKKEGDDEKTTTTTTPSLPRQQFIDSSVQGKIREELSKLRKQESDVQRRIEEALEKESLDRASQARGTGAKGKSSVLLKQELDDVRSKIERHHQRRTRVDQAPGVKEARERLVNCYHAHEDTTLECWKEVREFRAAVTRAESDFVTSLST